MAIKFNKMSFARMFSPAVLTEALDTMAEVHKSLESANKGLLKGQERLQRETYEIGQRVQNALHMKLSPGDRAMDMIMEAFRERERRRKEDRGEVEEPEEEEVEPDDYVPFGEMGTYREPAQKAAIIPVPAPSLWQRFKSWLGIR